MRAPPTRAAQVLSCAAMFTGIVQGVARVSALTERPGLVSLTLAFPPGFAAGLEIGASVAVDGVCLTVTALAGADAAAFDVMQQSLELTTLAGLRSGSRVNVERAARDGAEIGGHPLSGHVDGLGRIVRRRHGAERDRRGDSARGPGGIDGDDADGAGIGIARQRQAEPRLARHDRQRGCDRGQANERRALNDETWPRQPNVRCPHGQGVRAPCNIR